MLILIGLWISYFVIHSVLAADSVKNWFQQRMGVAFRYYRLGYNLIAGLSLIPVLAWQFGAPRQGLWEGNEWISVIGWGVLLLGIAIMLIVLRGYDLGEFSGLAYVQSADGEPETQLITKGLHRYVRHPLYLGILVLMIGFVGVNQTDLSLVLFGVMLAYLIIGSRLEEQKLLRLHGEAYRSYCKGRSRLIPFVY